MNTLDNRRAELELRIYRVLVGFLSPSTETVQGGNLWTSSHRSIAETGAVKAETHSGSENRLD